MAYKVILARRLSENEQKRMGWRALLCCFLMAFTFCSVFKPYIALLPHMALERSMASGLKMLMGTQEELNQPPQSYTNVESAIPIIQNLTNSRSQVYEINGDIRVHGNSSTIFIATNQHLNTTSWTTKPYARIFDKTAMGKIRDVKLINQNPNTIPPCSRSFDAPAVVFSVRGYTGNPFHDFTDVLIPLYLTSHQFNTSVVFLVANMNSWWTSKYKLILNSLSKYDLIDMDNQDEVLCFPRIIVGLKSHKELGIDQSKSPNYSMTDFTKFLRNTYSLERGYVGGCKNKNRRPRLLIISRKKTRHMRNEDDVADLARSIGFDVSVTEMGGRVALVAKFVNSFDVMVAVHGAGISNIVFLPQSAVLIQIVPIGLQVLSKIYFEIPLKDMNLRYLEYRVNVEESSLVEKYGVTNEVFMNNPSGLSKRGWHEFRSIYLDNQDVNVDLFRFRRTLLEAMELVCS